MDRSFLAKGSTSVRVGRVKKEMDKCGAAKPENRPDKVADTGAITDH
jgi:hypothetical protein